MSLPRYSEYKPSGVEWLGEIPRSWAVQPLKYSTHIYTGNSLNDAEKKLYESSDPDCLPYISSKDIDWATHEVQYDNGLRMPKEQNELKVAYRGSFLLCIEGGSAGKKVAMLSHDVCFVNKLCCFSSEENNKFKYYFTQTQNFKDKFELSMTGLIGGVATSLLKNFSIPTPSGHEQTAIANFLDRETGKIDALIAEQRRLVELLAEKRQAVISHAVTKGLNPNAKMKDSDIEWLGEVPEHWDRAQVGRVCKQVSDGPHFSPNYVDEGVMFLSARNIGVDSWHLDDAKFISEADYLEFCRRVIPEIGDVLYTKGGTTGIARVVDIEDRFQVWVHVAVLKVDHDLIDPYYLVYALNSVSCYEQSQLHTRGATNQDLGLTRMTKIWFALPPLVEQLEIRAFLHRETAVFDTLTAEANRTIALLQERRSALISAAVTGKIDVRQAA